MSFLTLSFLGRSTGRRETDDGKSGRAADHRVYRREYNPGVAHNGNVYSA